MNSNTKFGVVLINLGTPSSPSRDDVKTYLREFLSDPRVIDIPFIIRFLLVNLIIAPFRSKTSAKMYQKIWDPVNGSPLLHHSKSLTKKVAEKLGDEYSVKLAMRYGQPSIKNSVKELMDEGVTEIRALPLFPQYALATFESAADKIKVEAEKANFKGELKVLSPYFDEEGYIKSEADKVASKVKEGFKTGDVDHVVFTFHGLPVRHCRKTENLEKGEQSKCGKSGCCDVFEKRNKDCYRAQSIQTAKKIAEKLEIKTEDYTVAFQSRFGKDPWIEPFTDLTLDKLKEEGKKKVMVLSPSFATDCLETLEEVGIGLKEDFEEDSQDRTLIVEPCLNDDEQFSSFVSDKIKASDRHHFTKSYL